MGHIILALNVLKKEISKLNTELKHTETNGGDEEEIINRLQKLHRAINDINAKFNL